MPIFRIWLRNNALGVLGDSEGICPIKAPIDYSGGLFITNSRKYSTIVLGSPHFLACLAIGDFCAAGKRR